MSDFWTDDKFEDSITRATIALYETRIEKKSRGKHWSQITEDDLIRVRRKGIFIPAPDRIGYTHPDPLFDLPVSGCVAMPYHLAGPEYIESYCQVNYFKRLDKLPGGVQRFGAGVPYCHIALMPHSDGAPMTAGRIFFTVPGHLRPILAEPKFNRIPIAERNRHEASMGCLMFMTTDARNQWTITAHTAESLVSVGAYADVVKSLLYARELPVTPSGRKRPILHLVDAHKRRVKSGIEIDVRSFLRGTREIEMDGMKYTVQAPQRLIEELAA